jgi:hypothetical protein
MSSKTNRRAGASRGAALIGGALLAAITGGAAAVGSTAPAESSDWQYGLMIYGWLPSVNGDIKLPLPRGLGNESVSVSADQILDALQFTVMGSFEARKGDWSLFTDLIYLDLDGSDSKAATFSDGATRTVLDGNLQLTGWVWTFGGGYTVWRSEGSYLDLLAGGRLLALDADLTLTGPGRFQLGRKTADSVDLWDGIVGVTGRAKIDANWFVPYYLDVGAGSSQVTWQAAAGVGYAFRWGDVMLLYRHLQYDQNDDELLQNVSFGGGMLGVNFRF